MINELEQMRRENPIGYKSIVARREAAGRENLITKKIREFYPHTWMPIRIRMKSGTELSIGFQSALNALLLGHAELIAPPAVAGAQSLHGKTRPDIITLD